jgi:hypothetical protein
MNLVFQHSGKSATFRSPEIKSLSISKRSIICKSYVASSASTRINEGSERRVEEIISSWFIFSSEGKICAALGYQVFQKDGDRPT